MVEVFGRVTLFIVAQEGKINEPQLRGCIETPKGKTTITLWAEENPKVTGGIYYKGQVTKGERQ